MGPPLGGFLLSLQTLHISSCYYSLKFVSPQGPTAGWGPKQLPLPVDRQCHWVTRDSLGFWLSFWCLQDPKKKKITIQKLSQISDRLSQPSRVCKTVLLKRIVLYFCQYKNNVKTASFGFKGNAVLEPLKTITICYYPHTPWSWVSHYTIE